jgi:hypothetical protein
MRDISEIQALYIEIDAPLAAREAAAATEAERLAWQIKRMINDSAYFLLAFAQFEDAVRTRVKELVADRRDKPWTLRSPWDVIDPERLDFMDSVALLFEKGNRDYNAIRDYYRERNRIAHGQWPKETILVPEVVKSLAEMEARFPR